MTRELREVRLRLAAAFIFMVVSAEQLEQRILRLRPTAATLPSLAPARWRASARAEG